MDALLLRREQHDKPCSREHGDRQRDEERADCRPAARARSAAHERADGTEDRRSLEHDREREREEGKHASAEQEVAGGQHEEDEAGESGDRGAHGFISKWWWIGAIRKTRRPRYLNVKTWMITESALMTKMPPIRSSRNSVFVMIAKPARAPPIAMAPVSPMKTSAGKALYQRKPIAPPTSAAPRIARSSFVSTRWPGGPERMYLMTFIAVNVKRAMIPVPAARPSMPSVRFTPFAAPAMTKKRKTYHPHESCTSQFTIGIRTHVGRCWWRAANATPTVISARRISFHRALRPSERLWVSLMKSSRKPIAPHARVTKSTVSAGTLYLLTARNAIVAVTSMSRPPMVGVPCLSTCRSGPSSRMCWPNSFRRRNWMNFGPTMIEMTIATMAAMRTRVNGPPGAAAALLGRDEQARLGRRERSYLKGTGATEDDASRSSARSRSQRAVPGGPFLRRPLLPARRRPSRGPARASP